MLRPTTTTALLATLLVCGSASITVAATACDPDSGTIVPGGNVSLETWTADGSPYRVTGDISVSLLVIEEGVCVLVDGPYEITVATTIEAIGTAAEPIVFGPRDPASPWKGLRFQNAPPGSELRHCRIEGTNAGGIQIINSTPVIRDCTITGNSTTVSGGGLFIDISEGDFLLEDVEVSDNTASVHGGGIYAEMEAGTLRLTRCVLEENVANAPQSSGSYHGGGVRVIGDLEMTDSRIEANVCNAKALSNQTRNSYGGGLSCAGTADLRNCKILANTAVTFDAGSFNQMFASGGGIYVQAEGSLSATNSVIACNTLNAAHGRFGAGIYISSGASVQLENCSVANNSQEGVWHDGDPSTITNSIVYWNKQLTFDPVPATYGDQISAGESLVVTYSDVLNGYDGEGNINFSPAFACPCSDFRLLPGSPCIDSGNPDARVNDGCTPPGMGTLRNDMGAFGGQLNCNWPDPSESDLDGDGLVGFNDLVLLLGAWGPCVELCPEDLDGDNAVGFTDLALLLGNWDDC